MADETIAALEAIMQPEAVPLSLPQSGETNLRKASPSGEVWVEADLVVIIRGGGASSDLSDFDSYELAACIALFPLPVLTGIGHERDETVLDYVAHTRVKTPTAAAAFIIEHQAEEAALLDDLYRRITLSARERILREKQRLEHQSAVLPLLFQNFRQAWRNKLQLLNQRFLSASSRRIEQEKHVLQLLKQRLDSLDPRLLLKRGYTITTCGGKLVRNIEDLVEGDVLTTQTENGEILSKVLIVDN